MGDLSAATWDNLAHPGNVVDGRRNHLWYCGSFALLCELPKDVSIL